MGSQLPAQPQTSQACAVLPPPPPRLRAPGLGYNHPLLPGAHSRVVRRPVALAITPPASPHLRPQSTPHPGPKATPYLPGPRMGRGLRSAARFLAQGFFFLFRAFVLSASFVPLLFIVPSFASVFPNSSTLPSFPLFLLPSETFQGSFSIRRPLSISFWVSLSLSPT